MALLAVILIIFAASVVGMAGVSLVAGDLRIAGNYRDSSLAFWAADGALQTALETLRQDESFTGAVTVPALTNGAAGAATVTAFSSGMVRAVATGKAGAATKTVEAILSDGGLFGAAMTVGGSIVMQGGPQVGSAGIRLDGNGTFQLNSGTPAFNLFVNPASTVVVQGGTVNQIPTPPLNMSAYKLTSNQWAELEAKAAPAWTFSGGTTIQGGLNFNNVTPAADGSRTIYVNGNVVIQGALAGTGTIVATGTVTTQSATSSGATITIIDKGDTTLQFGGSSNTINCLLYTEGSLTMQGPVSFTGVVAVFGNVTMQGAPQYIGNPDPNFWETYSSAYNTIAPPVAVLSWAQDS
jgi:Tfp pilus assembly protein PilX